MNHPAIPMLALSMAMKSLFIVHKHLAEHGKDLHKDRETEQLLVYIPLVKGIYYFQ